MFDLSVLSNPLDSLSVQLEGRTGPIQYLQSLGNSQFPTLRAEMLGLEFGQLSLGVSLRPRLAMAIILRHSINRFNVTFTSVAVT